MRIGNPLANYTGEFVPDVERVLAAILFLMNRRPGITQYQIVKSIFLADKEHLNEFGRPITYDKYVAMPQGPVPSLVYALLMDSALFHAIYHRDPPWTDKARDSGNGKSFTAKESMDSDVLSRTDTEALSFGLATVRQLSGEALRKLLHEDVAYKEAWERRPAGSKSIPMKPALLLKDRNERTISLLTDLCFA